MNTEKKKVAFHTLGCKLNFAETSTLSRSFSEDQFERVPANAKADIYVINTCSVTDAADKKCRQAIKKLITLSPDAFIAVVGCYAQLKPQEISSIPGVDLVLGNNEKFNISDYITNSGKRSRVEIHSCDLSSSDRFSPSYSMGDRTRSFLKIQDGCDYGCSYCTIPLARGRSRNPEISSIISETEKIAENGIKEVVLTGVNIGDFGKSTGDSLASLIMELIKVKGIDRYRISSIEPNLLTDELIDMAVMNEKILPHFHIPLQSGSNKILGLMRRRYKRDVFANRVKVIREKLPLAGIGADVIVGFPGESDSDFEDTYSFLEEIPISYLHVFTFSERPGTIAENLNEKVSHSQKNARSKKLIALSEKKNLEFNKLNIGQITNVLFEKTRNQGLISGFTSNYIRVEYPWQSVLAGNIKKVKLKTISLSGRMSVELID
ncbi:MAG TPA: tRNA (N(6)-L-threonylcarbamoyladenosine(37)-C(2))-methylthiotransferase MtaB [Bacteroidales bacterium]|nr:tRNA (N(6)-L-threonylcarbamoyladenosine(37)-C(2))-methylthiotransferase MtaB [Bacteroidales bacterium]